MKKVFVVKDIMDYNGFNILGICESLALAEALASHQSTLHKLHFADGNDSNIEIDEILLNEMTHNCLFSMPQGEEIDNG